MKRYILFAAIYIGCLVHVTAATGERPVETDTVRSHELPELNIVALKQSGNLQKQAVSATTIKTEEIENDNISDIKNLSDLVPNLYIPSYGSRITSSIYMRGIGARMDQPSVGLTIDNMPVLNKDAYDLELPDMAEVEILRGPQSTLYGRNTMTGLINIRTLSPLNYQGLRLMGEGMANGSFRLQGGWYHKFKPGMGFSASVGLNSIHGDYRNNHNGADVGSEKSANARIKFEWQPSSSLTVLNTLSTSFTSQNGYAYEFVKTHEINYNDTCFYRRFLINDVLTLNLDLTGWNLSGIFSVQHINDNMTLDQDFLPDSYFNLTQKKQGTDVTAEIMGKRTGQHKYNWLGGIFAFYRAMDMQAPVTFKDAGIENLIVANRNNANPFYPIAWDYDTFLLESNFGMPSFGLAAYHESSFKTSNWTFKAALRLDYERITLHYNSYTNTGYTIFDNPTGNPAIPVEQLNPYRNVAIEIDDDGTLHTDFLTLLPKVSILYDISTVGNVYANFGKGYKAGGFNNQMFSDVLQQRLMSVMGLSSRYNVADIVKYKPEYSWNYEIGGHFDFRECSESSWSRLGVDLSLFYIDCRDQQLTKFPEGSVTGRMMTNAGQTRSYGAEISLNWNPWSTLTFNANYGYTNARFVKYNDGKADYKGKRLPYAPANTLYLQCLYTLSGRRLGNNSILFDLNLRGTGNIYWNEANTLSQPFYTLLGASVTFRAPKWEVQLWGRNLTATRYSTFYFMSMGNEFLQRGNKINAGLVLRIFI